MSDEPIDPPTPEEQGEPPGRKHREDAQRRAAAEDELNRLDRELSEVEGYRMPLMDHLIELKDRLLRAIAAVVLGTIVGFIYAREVYDFLTQPFVAALEEAGVEGGLALVSSPFEGIYTYFRVAIIAGIVLSSPVVSYQIWQFVAPGLYKSERRLVLPLSLSSVVLFLAGSAFCFYGIFPYAFPFFIDVLGVDVNLSVDGYLKSVLRMMLAFGVSFQMPVVTLFISRAGLVDGRDMYNGFRYAVVAIFVVAALITPPDPMTQSMLAVPLILLYALSIVLAYFFSTKQRQDEEDEDDDDAAKDD